MRQSETGLRKEDSFWIGPDGKITLTKIGLSSLRSIIAVGRSQRNNETSGDWFSN